MARLAFINLPVSDLPKAREFFTGLGFTFNEQFSDDRAASMVLNDQAFVMLVTNQFFSTFTDRAIADTTAQIETIVALSADSREEVDSLVEKAVELGGRPTGETTDDGFMYSRSFNDLDGHRWDLVWMDLSAVPAE